MVAMFSGIGREIMVAMFSGIVTGLLVGTAALLLIWAAAHAVVWANGKLSAGRRGSTKKHRVRQDGFSSGRI